MPRTSQTFRLLGSLALILTLVAAGMAIPRGASAQGADASVEIHKRQCPTGYSDNNYFVDCHDNPVEGVTFELDGLRDTTGTDGSVLFYQLQEGTYTVTENVPGEFSESVVFCSIGGDPNQPASFDYVTGGIRLSVPGGAEIVCDWYNIPYNLRGSPDNGDGNGNTTDPTGASVEIHARLCPAGYEGNEPFQECHDNPQPGVTFMLDGLSATTGQNGNTLFYDLIPQTFDITAAGQGTFLYYSVFCSERADVDQSVPVTTIDNGIRIELSADQDVICDWYTVPEASNGDGASAGQLAIHKAECPAGYDGQQFFADCHDNRLEGVSFDAYGPAGYARENETTDADGVLTFDGIDTGGTVSIREDLPANTAVYVVYCSDGQGNRVPFRYVDTDTEDGIEITVSQDDAVLCDWYNIPAA